MRRNLMRRTPLDSTASRRCFALEITQNPARAIPVQRPPLLQSPSVVSLIFCSCAQIMAGVWPRP